MSIPIQINNKTFTCKKKFIRENPSINDFLLNGSYIINIDGVDIEPYQDFLSNFFLNRYYLISESDLNFLRQLNQKIKSVDLQIKIEKLGTKSHKSAYNISNHPDLASLIKLEDLLLDLQESNFNTACSSLENMIIERKVNTITLIRAIFGSLFPCIEKIDLYIDLITRIDRSIEIKKNFCEMMVNFCDKSKDVFNREMCFIINRMIERGLIKYNNFSKHNPFFMHYMNDEELNKLCQSRSSKKLYLPEIKGNNFQQHRNWCKQGQNEHKIAEFIRKDDLQQIKNNKFDFKTYDHLPSSIYECHEIFGHREKHVEYAALYGAEKCFDFFIETMKYTTTNDKLARCAIIGGNNNIIKKCIRMNLMKQSCLQTALIYHRNELFEWLLDQKKSYSIDSSFFKLSLFHGCFKAIQIMIQHGVSPLSFMFHTVTNENPSLLHWCLLFDPDVNFKNGLMILNACETCKYEMMKMLTKYPSCNFNCRNKFDGSTCLHIACKFQDDDRVVKLIIERMEKGVIKAKQKEGCTALHIACMKGNIEIVKMLDETGFFNIGDMTKNGKSSLHLAASFKHAEVVRYFLMNHAEQVKSFIDSPTVQLCYDLCDVQITDMLYEMTNIAPHMKNMSLACEQNAAVYVDYLFNMVVQKKWQFECTNDDFILACKNSFSQIAHSIITNHVQLAPNAALNGKTSLHYACKNGLKEVVEFLVGCDDIDINLLTKRSDKGQTFTRKNDQEDQDDDYNDIFCYDDDTDDRNEVTDYKSADDKDPSTTDNRKFNQTNKALKKQARKERRQKLREYLKKSTVNLKDPFDKDTEEYIFNEEDDEDTIDKRKFDKFISEIRQKRRGRSAVSIACRKGHLDIVMLLLQTDKVDLTDTNLLFDAIYSNNKDLVNCVIDYMDDQNKRWLNNKLTFTSSDETPLQFVCRVTDDVEMFNLIFNRFPPAATEEDFNSYYYKEFQKKNGHSQNYYESQVRVFTNNTDFDYYRNENLSSLFRIAIENRHPKTAKFIIEKVLNSEDTQNLNDCLLAACKSPYKEILRTIIRSPKLSQLFEISNLDDVIEETCMSGRIGNLKVIFKDLELDVGHMIFHQTKNILHLAAQSPNTEILEHIIEMNNDSIDINMNEPDGDGYTALMLAAKKKNLRNTEVLFFNTEVNRSIVAHKKSIFSLCYRTGEISFVELPSQVGSIAAKDENLVLHAISASGSVELFQWLVDNKMLSLDSAKKYITKDGLNCFHTAIMNGAVKMASKLIQLNLFDANMKANDGRTPLQIAVDSKEFNSVKFLLNLNASSINSPYPKKRQTVLHKAVKEKLFDIVCLLLMNKNVNLLLKNEKGKTAEEICNSRRIMKMFEIRNSGLSEDEINKRLQELIDAIHKADRIKEKFNRFANLNRKIRFDYHVTSYEFDDGQSDFLSSLGSKDEFIADSSSDDDDDFLEDQDNEVAFVIKKKNKIKNKRSRARYRNRKKFHEKKE